MTSDAARQAVIAMTDLGRNGRFANQVFQYAFLRYYARAHGLAVQTPSWAGQRLFGFSDPLPQMNLSRVEENPSLYGDNSSQRDIDVTGFFHHTPMYAKDPAFFRRLFTPVPNLLEPLLEVWKTVQSRTVIGVHVRMGDYGRGHFFETPLRWLRRWLEERWDTCDAPLLYIASDERRAARLFKTYTPLTCRNFFGDLDLPLYYQDFWALSQCDRLVIANSSFSFAASLLNERATEQYRPSLKQGGLIPFSPWESPVLLHESTPLLRFFERHQKWHALYKKMTRGILFNLAKL